MRYVNIINLPNPTPSGILRTAPGENPMSNRGYIFDTTLRDGEQSPGCSMTVPEKLRMARKLVDLGVDVLEAGFPIASDGDYEAVDAVSREYPWVQVAALARCCTLDVERAASALKRAKRPRIHTFLATSPIHLKYKLKKSQDQVLDEAIAAVELARRHVDDVVMACKTRNDQFPFQTGIHTEHLYSASQLLSSIITFGPQPNKAIVGRNAFAHEAGIHQDGYLKEKSTYEIIDPKSVGVPEGKLVLGKHSGRHALKQRCEQLGYSLSKEELDHVYRDFTALADRKKGLLDAEIAGIVQESQRARAAVTVE